MESVKLAKHNLQKTIVKIIIEAKRNGMPCISNEQIAKQLSLLIPDIDKPRDKVKYSLYLLSQKEPKWNEPKLKRVEGGWTIDSSTFNVWKK